MIVFIRSADCPGCEAIEEVLQELTLAHRQYVLGVDPEAEKQLPSGAEPPVLIDEHVPYVGRQEILARLEELKGFKALWQKYQTDACYCGEDGEID